MISQRTSSSAIAFILLIHFAAACVPLPRQSKELVEVVFSAVNDLPRPQEDEKVVPPVVVDEFSYPDNCDTIACKRLFLKFLNHTGTLWKRRTHWFLWNFNTNITHFNRKLNGIANRNYARWYLKNVKFAKRLNTDGLNAEEVRRLKLFINKSLPMKKKDMKQFYYAGRMSYVYSRAQTVLSDGRKLPRGEKGMIGFFRDNRNYDVLADGWKQWRRAAGKPLRKYFQNLTTLRTAMARRNGYRDFGYFNWFIDFNDTKFDEKVMDLYRELQPFYQEMHAYVRYKLSGKYPGRFDSKGPIPAHILGNPWAQSWQHIFDIVKPYPSAPSTDVTPEMRRQNWTVLRMLETAEEFFTSLGLPKMTKKFWKYSMFTDPGDRSVNCHGSAYDMSTGDDFRIKMCAEVNQEMLRTVHHEMGHIMYDMLYAHQPLIFRTGANSGFHEAVGDTIGLSVENNAHLRKIGLLKSTGYSKDAEINFLMLTALDKFTLVPFALTIAAWRWRVYNGTISNDNYNSGWWRIRRDLQGLMPPVPRSEEDFDPGAKYHIANNVPYIRYYVSQILQFQFYEAMCKESGHSGPLHRCDFYQSKAAGALLKSVLSLGRSQPWPEALRRMTGRPEISTISLRRYFSPLYEWMKKYRKANKYPIGW